MDLRPTFVIPDKPVVDVIQILHRGNDGRIVFARKSAEGRFRHLPSCPAKSIARAFQELSEKHGLNADAYYTPIAFYREQRKAGDVRYITSCWVDIDCRDGNEASLDQLLDRTLRAIDQGLAPPPSLVKLSGRGFWLFWILRSDKEPELPPGGFSENCRAFRAIQSALHRRFAPYGADSQASDLARLTRIEGSLNREAGRRVGYALFKDDSGQVRSYTLAELAGALDADVPRTRYSKKWTHGSADPERVRQGKAGNHALWAKRLRALEALRQARKGWRKGCRYYALAFTATAMRQTGWPEEDIRKAIQERAEQCLSPDGRTPMPLESADVEAAIAFRPARVKNQYIADVLGVTPEEAALTGLPAAARHADPAPLPPKRDEKMQRRRDFLRGLPRRVSVREAHRLFKDKLGYPVSLRTAAQDVKAVWGPPERKGDKKP